MDHTKLPQDGTASHFNAFMELRVIRTVAIPLKTREFDVEGSGGTVGQTVDIALAGAEKEGVTILSMELFLDPAEAKRKMDLADL